MSGGYSQSGSHQGSKTKTKTQGQLLNEMIAAYKPSIGAGEKVYPGETVAPLNQLQTDVLGSSGDFLKSLQTTSIQNTPIYNQTLDTLSKIMSGQTGAQPITEQQATDYYQNVIASPAMKQFQETTMPTVKENFAGPGYWSSAKANAATKAAQDLNAGLDTQRYQLGWDVIKNNQAVEADNANRVLSAINPALQAAEMPQTEALNKIQGATSIYGLGAQEQTQRQNVINAAVEKFAAENRITSEEDLAIIMGLLDLNWGYSHGASSSYSYSGGMF